MAVYVVTYAHPDEAGWRKHVIPHVAWLQDRVREGALLASGPLPGAGAKRALLVFNVADRATLDAMIDKDPFAREGLIADLCVDEWDPIFGTFNALSSMPQP